jgi:hypothetical protein
MRAGYGHFVTILWSGDFFTSQLRKVTTAYVERQHRHWPELVEEGLLPGRTEELIRQMVEEFKERHRTTRIPQFRSHYP